MRKVINILWLEDDIKAKAHERRVRVVNQILAEKGYAMHPIVKVNFEEAKAVLDGSDRIDFFISDFNLNQHETGLNYLEEIRKTKGYKQFVILYSNKSNSDLKNDVIDHFKLPTTSSFTFSNFTFFSVSGNRLVKENFKEAIDVILSRWDELNALRGQYMYENAELELVLRNKLSEYSESITYSNLVNQFFRDKIYRSASYQQRKSHYDNIKIDWDKMIKRRNALAHVTEGHDPARGYYIRSQDSSFTIYENELDKERCDLLEVVEKVKRLL